MRITKRQLRRIIAEEMPRGGVPDVVGAITGVPQGNIQNLVDEYKEWAVEYMGTPSGANSTSVMATWIVMKGLSEQHDIHEDMAAEFGFSHEDLMREIKRQQKEYDAGGVDSEHMSQQRGFKEGKMRITKRQIRRIIKEEVKKFQLKEYDSGSPPPSWYEPDYGPEDTRPSANVDEIVQYFVSKVIGKTDTTEFMESIAKKVHDNDESWDFGTHEDFVNDPRVQEAMLNDPDVQEEIAAGGSIEDMLSEESFNFHYELADERERDY